MKIIFLNCWDGKLMEPLQKFIETQKADTDIFCFQEAPGEVQAEFESTLGMYTKHSMEKHGGNAAEDEVFKAKQATYVRAGIEIVSVEPILQDNPLAGFGLYTELAVGTKPLHIINMHGYPWPGKHDTPVRIEQSQAFMEYMKDKKGSRIIGGDLNVLPETQSACMFGQRGYQDLIETYNIATTRNHLSWDRFPDNKMYYSDYVFVDHNTTVTGFAVPDMEISDHLPLILEIQL